MMGDDGLVGLGNWKVRRRAELAELGFSENEINAIVRDEFGRMLRRVWDSGETLKSIGMRVSRSPARVRQLIAKRDRFAEGRSAVLPSLITHEPCRIVVSRPPNLEEVMRMYGSVMEEAMAG
jgi:hypothetical protein